MIRYCSRTILRVLHKFNSNSLYRIARFFYARSISKILIHVNNRCNYSCRYCYVDKTTKELSRGEWLDIIRQARKLGVSKVGILGGEPFCVPFLEELLNLITKLGMQPYIYTNGSLLTPEWIKKLKKYASVLVFKYDIDDETYAYHTGQNKYLLHDIEEKIKECCDQGLRVITFTTLLKRNVKKVKKMFDRSLSLGAYPAFERYLPVRDTSTNEKLEITDEENDEAMSIIASRMQGVMKEWSAALRILGRNCGCYSDVLSITPSGEVLPCSYLPESASLGNIEQESLAKINSLLQKKKNTDYKQNAECAQCSKRAECGGGCFTYSYLKKGKFEPHCPQNMSVGFCAYMLIDLYDNLKSVKL